MKTFKQLLAESSYSEVQKKRQSFHKAIKQAKLDGNGRFNTLTKAKNVLEKILSDHHLQIDSAGRYENIFRGDSDIIGDEGGGFVDIKFTENNKSARRLVVSWEHKESGYAVEVYLS
jgi:hypothetical protein